MKTVLIALILCCQLALAMAANIPLMPVRDLRPGMLGVGKTVISGDTIEEFNVEILGITGNEATGYSIFVRLYGDLIEKTGGVAQGMSGSPVFVDGRLVGAVAYGKSFNDPHYCFLTPIGKMLRLLDEPQQQPADWLPKGTALMAGGFTDYGLEYLQDKLSAFGLDVVAAGGAGKSSSKVLEPGSSIAASLMQGDMTLGALGTVTWADDEGNILAFGHSFMQRGSCDFFMNKVWVLGIVPNLQSGYKVADIGDAVGRFTQDRSSGIGGNTGSLPSSIPLFITVSDSSRGASESVRMQIADDEQLVPSIVDAAVVSAVSKTVDRNGGGTAKMSFTITGEDSKKQLLTIKRDNMFYSSSSLLKSLDAELTEALNILTQNKFEAVDIHNITVDAEVSSIPQVAEVVSAGVPKRAVKPGEKVNLAVKLKPYRGEEFLKEIYFVVPKDHPGGKLPLNVRGGSSMAWVLNLLRKQQEEGLPAQKKNTGRTLNDFIKAFNNADKNSELIVDISIGPAMSQAAAVSAASAEKNDAGLMGMLQGSPYKQKFPFDFIIDGEADIVLTVEKEEKEQ